MSLAIGIDPDWASPTGWAVAEQPGDKIIACGTIKPMPVRGRVTDDVQKKRSSYWVESLQFVLSRWPVTIPVFTETGKSWLLAKSHADAKWNGSAKRRPVNRDSLFAAAYAQMAVWLACQDRPVYSVDPNRVRTLFGVKELIAFYRTGALGEDLMTESLSRYGDKVKAEMCLALALQQRSTQGGELKWPANDHEADACMIALVGANYASRGTPDAFA